MPSRPLLAAASSLALAACATGPNYAPKTIPAAAAGPFISAAANDSVTPAQPAGKWWRLYDDPVLDGLVADALASNTDVRVAVAHLAKARAILREQRGAGEPQVGLSGSGQYGRLPGPAIPCEKRTDLQVDLGLEVAYEVDLFGRVSRNVEAARADAGAAAADADAVRVAVASETASAYADAVSSADRISLSGSPTRAATNASSGVR